MKILTNGLARACAARPWRWGLGDPSKRDLEVMDGEAKCRSHWLSFILVVQLIFYSRSFTIFCFLLSTWCDEVVPKYSMFVRC